MDAFLLRIKISILALVQGKGRINQLTQMKYILYICRSCFLSVLFLYQYKAKRGNRNLGCSQEMSRQISDGSASGAEQISALFLPIHPILCFPIHQQAPPETMKNRILPLLSPGWILVFLPLLNSSVDYPSICFPPTHPIVMIMVILSDGAIVRMPISRLFRLSI